jgi:uncharacterized protein YggE
MMTSTTLISALLTLAVSAVAGERWVSTIGSVQREVPADRVAMTLELKVTEKTIEASVARLNRLLDEFGQQMTALNYPATAVTVKLRKTEKDVEWRQEKRIWRGFSSTATLSLHVVDLANYGKLLTYVGTHEECEIDWMRMTSSVEGEARRRAIGEALQAARTKAALLAADGGAKLGRLLEVTEEEVDVSDDSFTHVRRMRNTGDPREGTVAYPIEILVRVKAKFELVDP